MKNIRNLPEINELILTGMIVSKIQHYKQKCVFTLENSNGRFFVQWRDPALNLEQGQQVMVRGSVYSVLFGKQHTTRVRASSITLLK